MSAARSGAASVPPRSTRSCTSSSKRASVGMTKK